MTDFASQGRTRGNNVADLSNLKSHQACYTALSRSASAEGTLIVQGFHTSKIKGRCSGGLRQEFRELELLDEITTLNHEHKLPVTVYGDNRNTLIKTFREWKGLMYVPKNVHPAIKWSKADPLLEAKIFDIQDLKNAILAKSNQKNAKITSTSTFEKDQPINKKLCLGLQNQNSIIHNAVPSGFIWSQNSCAYDAVFTIILSLWYSDKMAW
ncbi:hypothetical protein BJ912DRAFT_855609, partial [Pholiota molesta]